MNRSTVPMAYDLQNKKGDPLCHAVGCRKHVSLNECFGGLFCNKHRRELGAIRNNLNWAKRVGDLEAENRYRQQEIEFRKIMESGHMWYKFHQVENKLKPGESFGRSRRLGRPRRSRRRRSRRSRR